MALQLRKAERKQAKLKIGVFGPSGSGKTFSALKMARGLASAWDKIAIIDTENGSADLYSHLGDYQVITLEPPFMPEIYIEAIKFCESQNIEVIILDSITHEWAGQGGILELSEELGRDAKNSFAVWAKLTPRHNRFIDSILQAKTHVICCGRSKQDYALNQVEKNGKVVNVPEKIGLKSITREGFDYEMTVSFDLAISHFATSTKDRTGLFQDFPELKISEEVGAKLLAWADSGKKDCPTEEQTEKFLKLLSLLGGTKEKMEEAQKAKGEEITEKRAEAWLDSLGRKAKEKGLEKEPFDSDKFIADCENEQNRPNEPLNAPVSEGQTQKTPAVETTPEATAQPATASEDELQDPNDVFNGPEIIPAKTEEPKPVEYKSAAGRIIAENMGVPAKPAEEKEITPEDLTVEKVFDK